MSSIRKGSRYLDLFDDDLYKWFKAERSSVFDDHLDNLRLQMMACLLFDGSIVVPEQWLVSSPTFVRVASEIIEPWLALRDTDRLPTHNPPIVPAFFESHSRYADERFLSALLRRLSNEKGSPIRLSAELDTDSSDSVDFERRERFQNDLTNLLSLSRYDLHESFYVKKCFRSHIADRKMADGVLNIYECLRRGFPEFVEFPQYAYNSALNAHVRNVGMAVQERSDLRELNPDLHSAWALFFRKAIQDKVELSSISALRKILTPEDFDKDQIHSVETVGRYCMHASLSEMCHGELFSTAYNLYEPRKQGEFENILMSADRQKIAKSATGSPLDDPAVMVDSLDLLYRRGGGIRSNFEMDWSLVWKSFWEFKCSEAYRKDRETLLSRLRRFDTNRNSWQSEKWETYQLESWDLFFSRISKELRFIHFEMNPKDRRYVNITAKYLKRPKALQDFLKNSGYLGALAGVDYIHPGLAAPVMAIVATAVLAGQGIAASLSSDRALAGFELGAEVVKSRTQLRKAK